MRRTDNSNSSIASCLQTGLVADVEQQNISPRLYIADEIIKSVLIMVLAITSSTILISAIQKYLHDINAYEMNVEYNIVILIVVCTFICVADVLLRWHTKTNVYSVFSFLVIMLVLLIVYLNRIFDLKDYIFGNKSTLLRVNETDIFTNLFVLLVTLLILCLLLATSNEKINTIVSIFVIIPVVLVSLILHDEHSNIKMFIIVLYSISLVVVNNIGQVNSIYKSLFQNIEKRIAVKTILITAGITLIVVIMSNVFINNADINYKKINKFAIKQIERLKNLEIMDIIEDIAESMGIEIKESEVIDEGNIGDLDDIEYDNKTDLKLVTMKPLGKIYLKAYNAGVYDSNRWYNSGIKDYYRESLISALGTQNDIAREIDSLTANILTSNGFVSSEDYYTIKIYNVGLPNKYMYIPYYSDINTYNYVEHDIDEPLYTASSNEEYRCYIYQVDNILNLKKSNSNSRASKLEEAYRQYAYATYSTVSNELYRFREYFSDISINWRGKKIEVNDCDNPQEEYGLEPFIYYVQSFLTNDYTYSLEGDDLPDGIDTIEAFLFDRKSGRCVHFASAAVMMFRQMGIPARYVEGYAIDTSNAKTGVENIYNITDEKAHAWVEIYKDGFGWIPIEVTLVSDGRANYNPIDEDNYTNDNSSDVQQNTSESDIGYENNTETKSTTSNNNENDSTNTDKEYNTIIPTTKPTAVLDNNEKDSSSIKNSTIYVIIIMAATILITLLLFIIYKEFKKRRLIERADCRLNSKKIRKRINYLFGIYNYPCIYYIDNNEISDYIGKIDVQHNKQDILRILEILDKAEYSQQEIGIEEVDEASLFVKELYKISIKNLDLKNKLVLYFYMK